MDYFSRKDIDLAKWAFFALMAACVLLVLWVDERFVLIATNPEWKHIARFKWLLLVHGPFGATALLIGPFQFSDTLRRTRPKVHRWLGRIYVGAIAVSAPMAAYIGYRFEPRTIQIEQLFQAGGWFATTAIALICVLNRNFEWHKRWMMKSYGFCLVFILSRVPDAFPALHQDDQQLGDLLWGLVLVSLFAPDLILTARELWRRRKAVKSTAAR